MKLQNFHIDAADWSRERDHEALLAIRQQVFVVEQHVPESRERDGLDPDCWHVLARDETGQPIGCARLSDDHKIGRMAVLREWRTQGVGAALLRSLTARARVLGWPDVSLSAQVSAIGFYEREGFVAYGDVFDDAGLPHRSMSLALVPPLTRDDAQAEGVIDIQPLPVRNRAEIAAARLQVLADVRRRLSLHLPLLGNDSYASASELAEFRRIAVSGRGAEIRILLHDPAAALRNDHRLIALVQRLPSAMQIRTPTEQADLAYISSFLINDVGGYLFLPEADRPEGRAARRDRASAAPLQKHFDEMWERSERASMLKTLNI